MATPAQIRPGVEGGVRRIEARPVSVRGRLAESWHSRQLVGYFARRFNQKRYLRTWLGPTWLFLRPGLMIASQLFLFGGVLRVSGDGVPYPIAFLIGFSMWHLFAESAFWTTRCLELTRSTLRRMYLPRGPIIVAALGPAIVDLAIVLGFLCILLGGYLVADGTTHIVITPATALVPVGMSLLLLMGLGVGLWLSVPGAYMRDFRFGLGFVLNFWYFLTPVVYPLSRVPGGLRPIVEANPVTAPIEMVKLGLLNRAGDAIPTVSLVATGIALVILVGAGTVMFFRAESAVLDRI